MPLDRQWIAGAQLTEFQMSQAFYEYRTDMAKNHFSRLARRIDDAVAQYPYGSFQSGRGQSSGWDHCIAIVNGKPMECYRLGRFTLLVDPSAYDQFSVAARPKLGLVKRYALRLARMLRLV